MADMSAASHACQNNRGEFGKLRSQKKLLCHISTSTRSQRKQRLRKGRSTGDYGGRFAGRQQEVLPKPAVLTSRVW